MHVIHVETKPGRSEKQRLKPGFLRSEIYHHDTNRCVGHIGRHKVEKGMKDGHGVQTQDEKV